MRRSLLCVGCLASVGCALSPPRLASIDDILHVSARRHDTFGPTGERLFTERLDRGLGLGGQFSYIHHAEIRDPIRLTLRHEGKILPVQDERVDWYPSYLAAHSRVGALRVAERKFITDDDTLVDLVSLVNPSNYPIQVTLHVDSGFATRLKETPVASGEAGPCCCLAGSYTFWGIKAHGVLYAAGFVAPASGPGLVRTIRLEPGASVEFRLALAIAEDERSACRLARSWAERPDALNDHRAVYQAWFDENCPQFECDDPFITKLYWYRWFVTRHCLSRAATGNLPEPYFFEGTHQGHFSRLISFSSPHIITETRWLRDPQYAFGQVRNHCLNPDDKDAFFISARVDSKRGHYNNWIVASAWGAFQVHPDKGWLRDVVDAWAADVLGTFRAFDPDGDSLPVPRNHWTTGMEFQPAFFYFNDYDDTKPEARLERGDFVTYTYANANAVAAAYRTLGLQEKASAFDDLAGQIRHACLAKMWDDKDRFLYAIREADDAVARCREIVGFYAFAGRLFPNESRYTDMLAHLVDPDEFWTPFPPATVTKKCPAYTHKVATWPAAGGKTHGCMWNGPSWPHATSVILDVAAAAIHDYDQKHVGPEHFWHMFRQYTRLQYEDGDLARPMVTEYYDGKTGDPDPTGCPDYFHSTYCDLVIRHLVGLQPANTDRLVIRPVPGPVRRFSLRRVRYRGHDLDIVFNADKPGLTGEPKGLTVWVDGRPAGYRPTLGTLTIDLPGRPELGQPESSSH